jgi:hypothetical protein
MDDKKISISDIREIAKHHIESLRVTELTRAFLRREFDKFLEVVESRIHVEESKMHKDVEVKKKRIRNKT